VIAERDSVLAKLKKMSSSCLLGWCYSGSDSRGCQQLEAMRSICQAKRPEVPQLNWNTDTEFIFRAVLIFFLLNSLAFISKPLEGQ
jgi:hypothetical protein